MVHFLPSSLMLIFGAALLAPLLQRYSRLPAGWLLEEGSFADTAAHRAAYVDYLTRRLEPPRAFVEEAINAHTQRV